jgi:hypothetical protein
LKLRCLLVVPLVARGQVLGTFSVGRTTRPGFADDEVTLIEGLAARAALVVHTAQLHEAQRIAREAAEQAQARNAALHQLAAALSQAPTVAEIGRLTVVDATTLSAPTRRRCSCARATNWNACSRRAGAPTSAGVKTRAIAEAKVKTDKVDAEILAQSGVAVLRGCAGYVRGRPKPDTSSKDHRNQTCRAAWAGSTDDHLVHRLAVIPQHATTVPSVSANAEASHESVQAAS